MKRIILSAILGISLFTGCHKPQNLQYTVDRIEEGADGEQWAVVEVYNESTGDIHTIDIKVEEGYRVVE